MNIFAQNLSDDEIMRLVASNEREILAAQAKINQLVKSNNQLRRVYNARQGLKGIPVGQMMVIVGGAKG